MHINEHQVWSLCGSEFTLKLKSDFSCDILLVIQIIGHITVSVSLLL